MIVYPPKNNKEEKEKDAYKETILQSIIITNRCGNMVQALDYLNDNPELYDIACKALELFERKKIGKNTGMMTDSGCLDQMMKKPEWELKKNTRNGYMIKGIDI